MAVVFKKKKICDDLQRIVEIYVKMENIVKEKWLMRILHVLEKRSN